MRPGKSRLPQLEAGDMSRSRSTATSSARSAGGWGAEAAGGGARAADRTERGEAIGGVPHGSAERATELSAEAALLQVVAQAADVGGVQSLALPAKCVRPDRGIERGEVRAAQRLLQNSYPP